MTKPSLDRSLSRAEPFVQTIWPDNAPDRDVAALLDARQMQALASRLVLAEERERRRIALGLHDQIGQSLALAQSKLTALRDEAPEALAQPLEDVHALLQHVIASTRALTFDLSSPVLYELGLTAALGSLCEQFEHQHGLITHYEADPSLPPISGPLSVVLYRSARELMHNVVKHAHASMIWLSLHSDGDMLHLIVRDDGVGFGTRNGVDTCADSTGSPHSFGLFSIQQQLRGIGGHLAIETSPNDGAQVGLAVPCARPFASPDPQAYHDDPNPASR